MPGEVETMAYAGEVPWHGLGKPVHNDLTPQQIAKEAGVLWTVEKIPAHIMLNGIETAIDRSALVRSTDQKILDTVTNDWCPLQNEEAFEFFHEFVMAGDMEMHTAGSLRGGTVVWALAKVKDSFTIAGRDLVESHLLFTNPHQFGKAIDIRFTPIRVVCMNTLSLALGRSASYDTQQIAKISHRKAFDPEKAKAILGLAHSKLDTYREAAELLSTKRFNSETLNEFFKDVFPRSSTAPSDNNISRNHKIAAEKLNTQPGHDIAEGSWWQAFNVVTYMADHVMGRQAETRLQSAWFGSNRDLKTRALERAVDYAQGAVDMVTA